MILFILHPSQVHTSATCLVCGLGRATALTSQRDVIHYRVAASLPRRRLSFRCSTVQPSSGRKGDHEVVEGARATLSCTCFIVTHSPSPDSIESSIPKGAFYCMSSIFGRGGACSSRIFLFLHEPLEAPYRREPFIVYHPSLVGQGIWR